MTNDCSVTQGSNFVHITLGNLTIAFSYQTVIAFKDGCRAWTTSENLWGPTTGKHLNAIDGGNKKNRLPRPEFDALLEKLLKKFGLNN